MINTKLFSALRSNSPGMSLVGWVVILAVILGGVAYYFYFGGDAALSPEDAVLDQEIEALAQPEADESTSDEADVIEAELEGLDLEGLDAELGDIDLELDL